MTTLYDKNGNPCDAFGNPCAGMRAPWSGAGPSPMGYQGQVGASTASKVAPANVKTEILRWVGDQNKPTPGVLYLSPAPNASTAERSAFTALGFVASVTWEVGQTRHTAEVDVRSGGTALQLCGSTILVHVTAAAASLVAASFVPGYTRELLRPTRTVIAEVPAAGGAGVELQVPAWAQRVSVQSDQVNTIVEASTQDGNKVTRGAMQWAQNGQGIGSTPLAGAADTLLITQTGLVAARVAFVFELGF